MKKGLIICMMILFVGVANAQKKMVVTMKDGSIGKEFIVKNVKSITFDDVEPLKLADVYDSNVTFEGARVNVTLSGFFDNETRVGVYYSTHRDELLTENAKLVKAEIIPENGNLIFDLPQLEPLTTYYYMVYAQNENYPVVNSEVGSFTTKEKIEIPPYVDLGLSVKWARWNIGAKSVTEYGGRYVWADASGNLNLSSDLTSISKAPDNISGTQYDIATQKLGEGWRMPTAAEISELNDIEVESVYGYHGVENLNGLIFYRKNNSKYTDTLFIPKAGYQTTSTSQKPGGAYAFYWTAERNSVNKSNISYANIALNTGVMISDVQSNKVMMAIRAVYDNGEGEDEEDDGSTDKAGKGVDLGLSVKWADRNLGATNESMAGDYYAWGETETKSNYSLATHRWVKNPITDPFEPYVQIGEVIPGTVIYKIYGMQDFDAVVTEWSGKWRMPSEDEMRELYEKCTWTWSFRDGGVAGYEVKGTGAYASRSIFLPAAGYYSGGALYEQGTKGRYWTGTQFALRDVFAVTLNFNSLEREISSYDRFLGFTIRPVRDK